LDGGSLATTAGSQSWFGGLGAGPGIMLGGADNSATHATFDLNGGTLMTPNIGSVFETGGVIVLPANGATAVLNLNGGVFQATDSDSADPNAIAEGSDHLIFNTTHTYVKAGGAIFTNTLGLSNSIAVPVEHYPTGPVVDGGLTKQGAGILTLTMPSTYTGPTRVQAGVLVCSNSASLGGNSVDITDGATLALDFAGTTAVYKFTTNGGAPKAPGTYGATGSGAANIDDTHFTGTGTLTVLGTPTTPRITGTATVSGGSTITLTGTGGVSGGEYIVLGTSNLSTPITNWTEVAKGTFTSGGFSVAVPVTNSVPQEFLTLVIP